MPVAAAINLVTLRRMRAPVDLAPAVLIGALFSCVATLPLIWPASISAHDLRILALLGVVQLALPCMLMVRAARHLAPQEIALIALLEVVLGPIWAWLGAGEAIPVATMQGGTDRDRCARCRRVAGLGQDADAEAGLSTAKRPAAPHAAHPMNRPKEARDDSDATPSTTGTRAAWSVCSPTSTTR